MSPYEYPEPAPVADPAPVLRIPEQADMVRRLAGRIAAEMPEGTVASYMPLAGALLRELREPTGGMMASAFPDLLDYSDITADWRALIDAALDASQGDN